MRKLAVLALPLALAACGFHLRGEAQLPAAMQHVFVQSADPLSNLKRDLAKALARSGATVETKAGDGVAVMSIPVANLTTDVLSVGGNARAREYTMRYHVEFDVQDAAGKTLLGKQTLELTRDFTFDEQQALGIAAEQEILGQELERDMVQAILRRLEALSHAAP